MNILKVYPVILEKQKFSEVCHNLWKRDDGKYYQYSTDEGDRIDDSVPIEICFVCDDKLALYDYYVNVHTAEHARSIQVHTNQRHIINHQKDYRFKYCKKVVATNNRLLQFPLIPQYFIDEFIDNQKLQNHIYLHTYTSIIESGNCFATKLSLTDGEVMIVKK